MPATTPITPSGHTKTESAACRRKIFTRSSRFTRPAQTRRSSRCPAVSDARCGGSRTKPPDETTGAAPLSACARDFGTGDDPSRRFRGTGDVYRTGSRSLRHAGASLPCSSASRKALAVGHRSSGAFRSARSIASHIAFGASGRSSAMGRGRSLTCFSSSAIEFPAANGGRPVSIW